MTDFHAVLIIAVTAVVTLLLRALPFLIFNGKMKTPAYITYLSEVLPYAIIGMLVIYCLRGVDFISGSHGIPELLGVAVVIGLHAWRKNTLLSILAGTVIYMVLLQNWSAISSFITGLIVR